MSARVATGLLKACPRCPRVADVFAVPGEGVSFDLVWRGPPLAGEVLKLAGATLWPHDEAIGLTVGELANPVFGCGYCRHARRGR